MKHLFCLFAFLLNIAHAVEIEFAKIPGWQESILKKVEFDVSVRTTGQLLGGNIEVASCSVFLMFTAVAKENLEKRLLSVDVEVSFSDGRVRRFENIAFNLLNKGVECDVRKFSGLSAFIMPEDGKEKQKKSPIPKVVKMRILNAVFK